MLHALVSLAIPALWAPSVAVGISNPFRPSSLWSLASPWIGDHRSCPSQTCPASGKASSPAPCLGLTRYPGTAMSLVSALLPPPLRDQKDGRELGGRLTPAPQATPELSWIHVSSLLWAGGCGCREARDRVTAWRTRQKAKWVVVNTLAGGWEPRKGSPWPPPPPSWGLRNASWRSLEPLHQVWWVGC